MITVRLAEPTDADAAIDVVRRSITHLCVADHRNDHETLAAWLANKTPQTFVTWLSNPDNFCVVAESQSDLLGVGVLQRRGEILLFYLAPGAQRRGIGKKIHDALEEKAVQWQLASLHLDSTALARPFYEALGYRPIAPPVARFGVLQCFPYAKQLQPDYPLGGSGAKLRNDLDASMSRMIVMTLLAIAAFCVISLVRGAAYLETPLPGGLPIGNALAALSLCASAGAAVALSERGTALRAASRASLAAAAAWLPVSIALSGNFELNFGDGRGSLWKVFSIAVATAAFGALLWASIARLVIKRRSRGTMG